MPALLASGTSFSLERAFHFARLSKAAGLPWSAAEPQVKALGYTEARQFDRGPYQGIVAVSSDAISIAFRGTRPSVAADWCADLQVCLVEALGGRVHAGFLRGLRDLEFDLHAADFAYGKSQRTVWLTGHSLGGALATLLGAWLCDLAREPHGVYTFGCPRVGNAQFVSRFDGAMEERHFRVIHALDLVPRLPLRSLGYRDHGTPVCIAADGTLHEDQGFWLRLLDSPHASIEDVDGDKEGIDDHSLDRYLAALAVLGEASLMRDCRHLLAWVVIVGLFAIAVTGLAKVLKADSSVLAPAILCGRESSLGWDGDGINCATTGLSEARFRPMWEVYERDGRIVDRARGWTGVELWPTPHVDAVVLMRCRRDGHWWTAECSIPATKPNERTTCAATARPL